MKEKILKEIDKYLKNCKQAQEAGGMSEFGSAGGPMMLASTKSAFEELRKFVEGLEEPTRGICEECEYYNEPD